MKTLAIIAALILAAAAAQAAPKVVWQDGTVRSYWPGTIEWPDGRETTGANIEQCIAAGEARWETSKETATREAAEAAAKAEANALAALYADPEPAVFVPRVGDEITEIVGQSQIFVDAATGEVFALDETGSPEHSLAQKAAQDSARRGKVAAAKTAKGKGNGLNALAERVAALEALNGIK